MCIRDRVKVTTDNELNVNYRALIKKYSKDLRIDRTNKMALLTRAYAKGKIKNFNGALKDLNTLITMDSNFNDSAIFLRGWIHTNLKNNSENLEYTKEDQIDMSEFTLADNPKQICLGEGKDDVYTGLIAQEIEQIMPECIVEGKFGTKTVSNDPITWALVNAVKELSAKNDALETAIKNAGISTS